MPSSYLINDAGLTDVDDAVWSMRADVTQSGAIYGLQSLRAGHSPEGVYHSQIIDAQLPNPNYLSLDWVADVPAESLLEVQVRAGSQPDLSDAAEWDNVPVVQPGIPPVIGGRYAQVKVRMHPGVDALTTPQLRDFTLRWRGGKRYVDLAAVISEGPDHGIYEVEVNGSPLLRGVTVYVSVYKEVGAFPRHTRRMQSSAMAEIVPRN